MSFYNQIQVSFPLFSLIFLGYFIVRIGKWPSSIADGMTRFLFSVAIPIMLFRTMAAFYTQPPSDWRLLIAYFGSCIIVFIIGRLVAKFIFKYDGVSGSIFALGGIFSNNVMLGIPITISLLGQVAIPPAALVIAFNSLLLWSLVTISVEWSLNGTPSLKGFAKTLKAVLKNPVIIGIMTGTLVSFTKHPLPFVIDEPARMVSQIVSPLSLITLGMGLAEYRIKDGLATSTTICFFKLIMQPLCVWLLTKALNLPPLETKVVVLLGSMSTGINVYLMSRQFKALMAPTASSLLLSTVLSAVTTPLILSLI